MKIKIAVLVAITVLFSGCTQELQQGLNNFTQAPNVDRAGVTTKTSGVATKNENGTITIKSIKCEKSYSKISVGNVKCKSAHSMCSEVGSGLRDMLATSLTETGCFDVLDREAIEEMREEATLTGRKLRVQSADYMARGAITTLKVENKASAIGGGIGALLPGALGAVAGSVGSSSKKATLGMDIKIYNPKTSSIKFSKHYNAVSGKTTYGFVAGGLGGIGFGSGAVVVGAGGGSMNESAVAIEEVSFDILSKATMDIVKRLVPKGTWLIEETVE